MKPTRRGISLWPAWRTLALLVMALPALIPAPAWGLTHLLPENGDSVVGRLVHASTDHEDTFAELAQRYSIGYAKLRDANPEVDPWLPGDGTPITLPFKHILPDVEREGIVMNLSEYRLYYFLPEGNFVAVFPIGIGREEFPTPIIDSEVVTRIEEPSWTPPAAARVEHAARGEILPPVVPPGPDNPLGPLAMQLDVPGYFIHGTNHPFGVGQRVSQGCIRLYNDHISELVELVPNGTRVRSIDQPYKVGWKEGELYLEVHRPIDGELDPTEVASLVIEAAENRALAVDWKRVEELTRAARGVPERITRQPEEERAALRAARESSG